MNTLTIILILAGLCGVLLLIIFLLKGRIDSLKNTITIQNQTIKQAEENIQEVQDVQQEINRLDAEASKPEAVPPAATGDSGSRIERLDRLFNNEKHTGGN